MNREAFCVLLITFFSIKVIAQKSEQTISFSITESIVYSDTPYTLNAQSTSGLAITYEIISGEAVFINGSQLMSLGAGEIVIEAQQEGNEQYNAALPVRQNLTVDKAEIVAFVPSIVTTYGDPLIELNISYDGFVGDDGEGDLDILPTAQTNAAGTANAGWYIIFTSGGADDNYNISTKNSTYFIQKADLLVFTESKSKDYLEPLPDFPIRYEGFKFNDSPTDLTQPAIVNVNATENSDAGVYEVFLNLYMDTNYNLINGNSTGYTLTINPIEANIQFTGTNGTFSPTDQTINIPVETSPDNINYNFLIDGSPTLPSNSGLYNVTVIIDDNNYFGQSSAELRLDIVLNNLINTTMYPYVYPNPSDHTVFIEFEILNDYQSILINSTGQIVLKENWTGNKTSIRIDHLPNGIYFLHTTGPKGEYIKKLMKY